MANAILIPGKEKRVYGGHPWVFRSDIARVEGDFTPGDIVSVYSSKGKFLAKAFYNPQSQISLRIMSLHDEPIDRAFIFRRVKEAVDYRRTFADLRSWRCIGAAMPGAGHGALQAGCGGRAGGRSASTGHL